ncbi:MAG: glycoside hydrolase family 9 protein [Alphaproteobacteria bacterium]|nr:glycoside hydrolase family 9 protein [Alphaproteobacteria bacterium]
MTYKLNDFCKLIGLTAAILLPATAVMAENLIRNHSFDENTDIWWGTDNVTPALVDGQLCVDVPANTGNPWDVIVGINDMGLVKGEKYGFKFEAKGTPGGNIRALVQMPTDPWTAYATVTKPAVPNGDSYSANFKSIVDMEDAQIVFQIGGSKTAWQFCLDNVELNSGTDIAQYKAETATNVRVNQLGYLPDGPKHANLVLDKFAPQKWTLLDAAGGEVATGFSKNMGVDPSAGDEKIHLIDFSDASVTGDDFKIVVRNKKGDDWVSDPFAIRADLYKDLLGDALSYFYPVRSGIEIDGALAGAKYARPAGHLGIAPNTGDTEVGCQTAEFSQGIYGEAWTCDYKLDVTGGWYDAGDHGKYVVNGGISVGQLLATFERSLTADGMPKAGYGDGMLAIPESGNGIPDILDEAKWELDFMLKMVVPAGKPHAGLVHHKVHDSTWTGLPLMPHLDDRLRELHRPSTAATLNLAAVAAQASRLFMPYDATYAAELENAAMAAYAAAKATPDLFAPAEDGNSGGGPYNDTELSDEFFWVAVELFLTSGEDGYKADFMASVHWTDPTAKHYAFDWGITDMLARLSLSYSKQEIDADIRAQNEAFIVAQADKYLDIQAGQIFGMPYAPPKGVYDWGSTHLIIQNAIVMATAYEMTGDGKYRDGALETMDYILGRNALNNSYVTGYGSHYSENQHSRWFSAQLNADLPHPPKGSLSGGPNSSIQDPVVQNLFGDAGCPGQTCYIDDIESWSTNEITINWNAALVQMAAFLKDQ